MATSSGGGLARSSRPGHAWGARLRRFLQIALLVAAVFQVVGFAAELEARLGRWSASRARFDPERPASRAQMEAEVARLFPVMLREVPRDATLTLFNSRIY